MFESQAKYFINNWRLHEIKVLKYIRPLFPIEYIVLSKANEVIQDELKNFKSAIVFVSDKEKSTFSLPMLTEDQIISMVANEELIYDRELSEYTDTSRLKTGGCNCGAWVLGSEQSFYQHSTWCPLYKNPHEKV